MLEFVRQYSYIELYTVCKIRLSKLDSVPEWLMGMTRTYSLGLWVVEIIWLRPRNRILVIENRTL